MADFSKVEKKDALSYEDFIEGYLKTRTPVVLKNATSVWKSNEMFTPEFFSEHFGQYKTRAEGNEYTVNEILELTKNSTPENPAPYPILFEIPEQMPELLNYLDPVHLKYSRPNWFSSKLFPYGKFGKSVHLFFGGRGNQYSLHKDFFHTNAWITQLYGEKKFVVFPESQDEYLYAGEKGFDNFISPINILKPDFDKYPKYKNATPLEVILEPGETIFVPNGVWHTTVGMSQNISLIFDQLNAQNSAAWAEDMYTIKKDQSTVKALLAFAFAKTAGALFSMGEAVGVKY